VALVARVDDFARLADQLLRPPAEHLGELRVAEEKAAVARERDADRQVGEQRLVLELGIACAPRIARGRLRELRRARARSDAAGVVHRLCALVASAAKSSEKPRRRATALARCSALKDRSMSISIFSYSARQILLAAVSAGSRPCSQLST